MPKKKIDPAKNRYRSAEQRAPDVPRVAYTIPEFCSAHRFSLSMYYKMRAAGTGPRESHAGTKILITLANAAAWLKKLEEVEAA